MLHPAFYVIFFLFFWQFLCKNIFTFFKRIFRGKLTLMMKKSQEKTNTKTHALSTIIEVDLAIVIIIIY